MEVTKSTPCIGHGTCSNLHDFTEKLINLHFWTWYSWVFTILLIISLITLIKYSYIVWSSPYSEIRSLGGEDASEMNEFKSYVPSMEYIRRTSKLVILLVLISHNNACQQSIVLSSTGSECLQNENGFNIISSTKISFRCMNYH